MRIAVIGTGYVGLVSGACFSEFGVEVVCVDKDAAKIARLQRGEMPIYEPGLEAAGGGQCGGRAAVASRPICRRRCAAPMRCSSRSARRRGAATGMPISAMSLPPPRRSAGRWPTRPRADGGGHQIDGAGRHRARRSPRSCARRCPAGSFDVASNPEFLREGSAIEDFMRPDRVVIGADSEHARERDAPALPAALSDRDADACSPTSRPPS